MGQDEIATDTLNHRGPEVLMRGKEQECQHSPSASPLTASVFVRADAPEWASIPVKLPPFTFGEKMRRLAVELVCLLGSLLFGAVRFLRGARETEVRMPRKILLIRRGGIGDALLVTPLLRTLKEQFPQAHIQFLTSRQAIPILAGNPYVDELIEFPSGKKEWLKLVRRIRRQKVDTALILHRIFIVPLLTVVFGIPQRLGHRWKRHGFALTAAIPFDAARPQVTQITELITLFGRPVAAIDTEIYLSAQHTASATAVLAEFHYDPAKLLVAIHPGTSEVMGISQDPEQYAAQQQLLLAGEGVSAPRRWPSEYFARLADMLIELDGCQVLVLKGPADEATVQSVLEHMKHRPFGVSPKMDLKSFSALLKSCDLVIANDSGPMHMARAVGTPVLAIFGPSHAGYLGPLGARHRVAWNPLPCSPCCNSDELATANTFTGAKVFRCWRGDHSCMRGLLPEQVYALAHSQLKEIGVSANFPAR